MEVKKILYGITLSQTGGAQSVLYQLIKNLKEDNYKITLVTSSGDLIDIINDLNKNRVNKINVITIENLKREIPH